MKINKHFARTEGQQKSLNVTVERAAYIHRKTVDKDLIRTRFITRTLATIIFTSGARILKNKVRAFQWVLHQLSYYRNSLSLNYLVCHLTLIAAMFYLATILAAKS
jgi:hypothetical protein